VDLEELLSNGSEEARDHLAELLRFAALTAWVEPITVCTVDTVLGLMQNNRRGVFAFPAIADGAFVFDEIHQYDDRLFAALLRFLETFRGVPILLMTASLPRARLTALRASLARLEEPFEIVDGPSDLEALKRYRILRRDTDSAWDEAVAVIEKGGRTLWVANTVERAVQLASAAEAKGLPVLPYHSRDRYEDRLERHRAVVTAFAQEEMHGVLAVTTQVCEISLDLSADLLVTEPCAGRGADPETWQVEPTGNS
jgi:CRISPR-associated endonuclease/helicase Cas3